MPYILYKQYIKLLNNNNKILNFYTHTWELDTNYPKLKLGFKKNFIQYYNLKSVKNKIENLLLDFKFCSIDDMRKEK